MIFYNSQVSFIYTFFIQRFEIQSAVENLDHWKNRYELSLRYHEGDDQPLLRPSYCFNSQFCLMRTKESEKKKLRLSVNGVAGVSLVCKMGVTVKIRENGSGTFRIDLAEFAKDGHEGESPLEFEDIKHITSLGDDLRGKTIRAEMDGYFGKQFLMWEEFSAEMMRLVTALRGSTWIDQSGLDPTVSERGRISLVAHYGTRDSENQYPLQYPYPVIYSELEEKEFNDLMSPSFNVAKETLLKLIVRPVATVSPKFNYDFLHEYGLLDPSKQCLISFSPINTIFRNFTIRAAALIRPQGPPNKMDILLQTLETFEMFRHKVYLPSLTNIWLDKRIQEMEAIIADLKRESDRSTSESFMGRKHAEELAEKRASDKAQILRLLEDPVAYNLGASSLVEMYDRAVEIFRIKHLEDLIARKDLAVDRMYDQILDYIRLKEIKSMEG